MIEICWLLIIEETSRTMRAGEEQVSADQEGINKEVKDNFM